MAKRVSSRFACELLAQCLPQRSRTHWRDVAQEYTLSNACVSEGHRPQLAEVHLNLNLSIRVRSTSMLQRSMQRACCLLRGRGAAACAYASVAAVDFNGKFGAQNAAKCFPEDVVQSNHCSAHSASPSGLSGFLRVFCITRPTPMSKTLYKSTTCAGLWVFSIGGDSADDRCAGSLGVSLRSATKVGNSSGCARRERANTEILCSPPIRKVDDCCFGPREAATDRYEIPVSCVTSDGRGCWRSKQRGMAYQLAATCVRYSAEFSGGRVRLVVAPPANTA